VFPYSTVLKYSGCKGICTYTQGTVGFVGDYNVNIQLASYIVNYLGE